MKHIKHTADKPSMLEQLIKRFANSLQECRTIDTHITECHTLILSCRVAEAAHQPSESNRALLALHLRQCGFKPTNPDDLDSVTDYLNAVHRGNEQLMYTEENAIRAMMRIPFAYKMLPVNAKHLDADIAALMRTAERTIQTADKLTREFTIAGLICDIVEKVESFAVGVKHEVNLFTTKQDKMLFAITSLAEQEERHHQEQMNYRTGNLTRQDVAKKIVSIQLELLRRERNKHPFDDPTKIKGYSNARVVKFVQEECNKDDFLYKGCADCRSLVKRIAEDEGKKEEVVWRGMIKAVEREKKR